MTRSISEDIDDKSEYEELLQRDLLDSHEGKCALHDGSISPLLLWLAAAVAIIAFIDIFALAYSIRMFNTVFQDRDFEVKLEYANPYIGLKELYELGKINSSKIDPILIRPRISAQVYLDEPDQLTPRGERDYWSAALGTLSPNERHLHIEPKIHTIVQFRAIDFGMEDCHLTFTLPKPGETLEKGATYAMRPYSHFDIFRLAEDRPIDVKKLSFRTKPSIAEKVATVQAGVDGDMLIHRFPCAWSMLRAFEIACVNIYQHQTI
ncbi:hypothetical protein C8Q74DRAFT_1320102 [Fomes fomentarius]|nr:hypothetical protein C8Q74DRAFT_1320102 [Fomes fomentarius]